ncbi:MAG: DUF2061 domain-containing protein [Flavobacteriaceae bacterium]|jgi:uncharacterized membrane protein|nr:DUF2061 domain-containing protein [Flavobacteriaceae bacterium]MDG2315153.1 DUF2061 domain-containing protein [Flavobacteriaceae bacterium]
MIIDQYIFQKRENVTERKVSKEKVSRSLLKSISWRIIGTLDTILISYWITGAWSFAMSIGAIELVTKMGLYIVHERIWNRIPWGKS